MRNDGKHIPNKKQEQCQCVWDHSDPRFWHTIAQCQARRDPDGNIFCEGCQEAHAMVGDELRKKGLIPS